MNRLFCSAIIAAAIAAFVGPAVHAQTFDLYTQYTDSVTPVAGNPWSYGLLTSATSFTGSPFDTNYYYTNDKSYSGLGTPTYPPGDSQTLVGLGNLTGTDSRIQVNQHPAFTSGSQHFAADSFTLRGNSGTNSFPYARFTAGNGVPDTTGTFSLTGSFTPIDYTFTSHTAYTMTYSIVLSDPTNGVTTLFNQTINGTGTSAQYPAVTFSLNLNLVSGDLVDFVESGVNNANSTTTLAATFTEIPEPSTWFTLLAGAGLGLMLCRRAGARA